MNRKERRAAGSRNPPGGGAAGPAGPMSQAPGLDLSRDLHAALQHYQTGDLDRAAAIYERILKRYPDHPDALNLLGLVAQARGETERAITLIRRALEVQPDFVRAHNNLGNLLKNQKDLEGALRHYQRTIELDPRHAKAHYNLGRVFEDLMRLDDAVAAYRRAIECDPGFAEAHNNLGHALYEQGAYEEAEPCFRRALDIDPDNAERHRNLGTAFQARGDFKGAIACFRRAIELNPDYAPAYASLVMIQEIQRGDPLIARIEQLVRSNEVADLQKSELHFALGKCFNGVADYDRAFQHYYKANELAKKDKPYSLEALADIAKRTMAVSSREFFAARAGWGGRSDRPVFIVGMPRSGTTLVEQILSSHPDVFGAGELRYFGQLEQGLADRLATATPYPECYEEITREQAIQLGQDYLDFLDALPALPRGIKRVIDKAPSNFRHLGLIALLVPGARVIHCSRNAMDVCLSCYFQNFRTQPFTHDLWDTGRFYRDYERFMEHWRAVLPLPTLEVRYETLVAEKDRVIREIVEFCGLEWNDACLAHDKTERTVKTASLWQVRQPVYKGSVDRWRRYEKHLDPLKRALGYED